MALGRRRRRSISSKARAESGSTVGTSIDLDSLPQEVITRVLAIVASQSLTDLFNVKLSCKYLLQLSDNDLVFEKASIDEFRRWNTSKQVARFLKRCEESGNPAWLYRLGLYEYFSTARTNYGLNCLKRAAEKGHIQSSYVCSIILICSGGALKAHGLKMLASLKRFRTREFREKIREDFRRIWTRNIITLDAEQQQEDDFNVRTCGCLKNWRGGRWEGEDAAAPCCDSCFCCREVKFFCELIWSNFVFK